ncbi:phage major capsid protein [Aneurinibacillus thermoaerophilus]|uniref:Phage major capsid protein, HK97 family n=1 Tax=Aneurinibacillus thermoaerophilus TaxID=143495 RepID=A0A1G8ETF1_ANETH|nr:phage major capsid protein [Aneurinibacillus thermoaerophilus]MED0757404.1 phage major capsid protein [Aneurinibacillus thermoaerophilus]MED0762626.1 phage major capsid protein [Aneurinibacillus thermoaerophilus]SDH73173.1 phage major capsid protein, HK97 family [Aneurinibacillus thermoaerophilus]
MKKIRDMRQKRASLIQEARQLIDGAEQENRSMTAEEEEQYDRIMQEVDQLKKDIDREERQLELERELEQREKEPERNPPGAIPGVDTENRDDPRATQEYRDVFMRYVMGGREAVSSDELRSLMAGNDTKGGYIVAPKQFVNELLKKVDDSVVVRQLARIIQLKSAKSLGVPTLEEDMNDAEWTSELRVGNEGSIGFGQRELTPHPLAKWVKISNKLLSTSAINVEDLINARLAYKFAVTMEKAYMTGDGDKKPLGLFTASRDGIDTDRDVSGGNTATAIKADSLIEAKYSLKPQYQPRAKWIFHRDIIKEIRKLKDNNGQYIWQAGITNGAPDRILEIPYLMSEYAPNEIAGGKYIGILGDFQFYWIADALDFQMQRLLELFATSNQTGFIGRMESDGMPVMPEAFVRLKMG